MGCFSCDNTALGDALPPRESVVRLGSWRVAHAFDSSLPGWLVVLPARHVLAVDELTEDESADLGLLLRRLSVALKAELGCRKTYVMLFAEAEGFSHLHVHVVPRMPWFAPEQMGPRVFSFLGHPVGERVSDDDQDALALQIRAIL